MDPAKKNKQEMVIKEEEEEEEIAVEEEEEEKDIVELRKSKFVQNISPIQIIDDEESASAIENINLLINVINHGLLFQYWSLKPDDSTTFCCNHPYHADHHHIRDDEDEQDATLVHCQVIDQPQVIGDILEIQGVFASSHNNNYTLLEDLDILYESEIGIFNYEELEMLKRGIMERISMDKTEVLEAKSKTVRIRVDLSHIIKKYYPSCECAASDGAKEEAMQVQIAAIPFPPAAAAAAFDSNSLCYKIFPAALRSSREELETKIIEKEDLVISESCQICMNKFGVGVDEIKKMPCDHIFHYNCLVNWLFKRNTCPVCGYELPTYWTRFAHLF